MNNYEVKKLLFFDVFCEIVRIFIESEIGSDVQLDIEKIAEYVSSFKFATDLFDYSDRESMEEYVTDLILSGMPVWRFAILSDFTERMIEKSFSQECYNEYKTLKENYCCLSCKYYKVSKTSIGLYQKCTWQPPSASGNGRVIKPLASKDCFELQTTCPNFQEI